MSEPQITFDENGFNRQGFADGVYVWLGPKGDEVELHRYSRPPDIEANLRDVHHVRSFFRRHATAASLGVVEIETCVVDECMAVRTVFKVCQPMSRTYLGALTFPFRDFSYVLKVLCPEFGITGLRDSMILAKLISSGEVKTEGTGLIGWLDDPYDSGETGPMTRNRSERPEYDMQFPDHPLSRARWILDHLQRTVKIDDATKKQHAFGRPV